MVSFAASVRLFLGGAVYGAAIALIGLPLLGWAMTDIVTGVLFAILQGGILVVSLDTMHDANFPASVPALRQLPRGSFFRGLLVASHLGVFVMIPLFVGLSLLSWAGIWIITVTLSGWGVANAQALELAMWCFSAVGWYVHCSITVSMVSWAYLTIYAMYRYPIAASPE